MLNSNAMKQKILVVDDEPDALEVLGFKLKEAGYVPLFAEDGARAITMARDDRPALIVLDLMLPEVDGLEVCKILRRDPGTAAIPIIMLTARAAEMDRVLGLELGADDYVTKPFGVHELLARVEALLRRARVTVATGAPELPPTFRLGAATVDRRKFTVSVAGGSVALTARELKLAEVFAAHPGDVLTRDALLNAVWGVDYFGTTRTLDQHVAQLRKKIEPGGEGGQTIVTVHGVGYRLAASSERV